MCCFFISIFQVGLYIVIMSVIGLRHLQNIRKLECSGEKQQKLYGQFTDQICTKTHIRRCINSKILRGGGTPDPRSQRRPRLTRQERGACNAGRRVKERGRGIRGEGRGN